MALIILLEALRVIIMELFHFLVIAAKEFSFLQQSFPQL